MLVIDQSFGRKGIFYYIGNGNYKTFSTLVV